MTIEELISAVRLGFGVTQSAARLHHAALVEAGSFERRSSGTSAKPVQRAEAMALVYSLMATGGKGEGLSAVMAARRLTELTLDTVVASKPMAAPPFQLPPGIRFTDCIERILCAIETGGLADWIVHRQGELIVTIDQLATAASISLTCIEREHDAEVAVAWFWRFCPRAGEGPGASQPCRRSARRLMWTLQTLLPLGEALRGVS